MPQDRRLTSACEQRRRERQQGREGRSPCIGRAAPAGGVCPSLPGHCWGVQSGESYGYNRMGRPGEELKPRSSSWLAKRALLCMLTNAQAYASGGLAHRPFGIPGSGRKEKSLRCGRRRSPWHAPYEKRGLWLFVEEVGGGQFFFFRINHDEIRMLPQDPELPHQHALIDGVPLVMGLDIAAVLFERSRCGRAGAPFLLPYASLCPLQGLRLQTQRRETRRGAAPDNGSCILN